MGEYYQLDPQGLLGGKPLTLMHLESISVRGDALPPQDIRFWRDNGDSFLSLILRT